MPNPKPASLPRWADVGGGAGIAVPAAGNLDTGWFVKQKMPAQWLNWLFNLIYQWCAYLFDFENNLHTWANKQTFNHNTLFFAGTQEWNSASPWLTIDNNPIGVGSTARQALYIIGKTGIDPSLSLAGGVISITNAGIGACLRASNSATGGVAAWLNNTGDSSTALKLFENAGDTLGVALDIILTSSNGTALQAVGATSSAFFAFLSNNGAAPTLKVENTGAGKALEIGAGNMKMSGPTVAAATAQLNQLSPGLLVKAWAVYNTDAAGNVTLLAGQNVSGVAIVGSTNGNGVEVTWAQPFNSADHVCINSRAMQFGTNLGFPTGADPQTIANLDTKVNIGHWNLQPNSAAVFLNAAAVQLRGFVAVLGNQ